MYKFLETRIDVRLLLLVVLAAVCVVGGLFVAHETSRWRAKADRQRAEADRQRAKTNKLYAEIQQDICEALTKKMESLPDDDPIIRRYGRFRHLRAKYNISSPSYSYTWQLAESMGCGVLLEFEKGKAGLSLGITHGPVVDITQLDMSPSGHWASEHPEKDGWVTVPMIEGWATHPSAPYYGPPPPSPPPDYP
jgi:hypothetical protein